MLRKRIERVQKEHRDNGSSDPSFEIRTARRKRRRWRTWKALEDGTSPRETTHQSRKGVGSYLTTSMWSKDLSTTPRTSTTPRKTGSLSSAVFHDNICAQVALQVAKRLHNREIPWALEHPETSLLLETSEYRALVVLVVGGGLVFRQSFTARCCTHRARNTDTF